MALPPAVIVTLSPSMAELGTRIGMAFLVGSLGMLISSPIAGAILKAQTPQDDGSALELGDEVFWGVLVFTGAVLIASGLLMTGTRSAKVGSRLSKV